MLRVLTIGLALLAAGGCAHRAGTATAPPASTPGPAPAATAAGPRLLFLSGQLTAAVGGPSRLEVLHLQAVPGALKQLPPETTGPAVLSLTQLDAGGQALARLPLPHPLRPAVEAVGDDQRTFVRSQARLPKAEFFARLTLLPGAVTLRVTETLDTQTVTVADLSLVSLQP